MGARPVHLQAQKTNGGGKLSTEIALQMARFIHHRLPVIRGNGALF